MTHDAATLKSRHTACYARPIACIGVAPLERKKTTNIGRRKALCVRRTYDIMDTPIPLIDSEKYARMVNTLDAVVTVRWNPTEQTHGQWPKFTKATNS